MREMKWSLSFTGKRIWELLCSWFLDLLNIGLLVVEPLIMSKILDDYLKPLFDDDSVSTSSVLEAILPLLLIALGIIVFRMVIKFISNIQRDDVALVAVTKIRKDIYEKLGRQSRSFFMNNRSGDLINKCTGDIEMIRHFIAWVSYSMFESIVMVIVVLTVFFTISWKFTLCLLALSPFAFITAIQLGKHVRPVFGAARNQLSKLNTVVSENIEGNRVVRAFCREPFEIEKFDKENNTYYDYQLEANKMWVKYSPILETVANIMNCCAIILGAVLVIFDEISLGQLTVFTSLSWMLNSPMQQIGSLINDFQRFNTSCERVHELYDMGSDIVSPENAACTKEIKGQIDINHAALKYDGQYVIKDIDLHIPAGSTVGIMGATGSGKSTLLNLITRFVDVNKGNVMIDGVDVKNYDLQHLRRNVAVALQDVFLFSDTAESNIAYGVPDVDVETVYKSAVDADADSFIRKLPEGYDTIIGERGMGLSGGQKQRLSLARALAMRAPILMLDDTTSAVDLETEKYIQERLNAREKKGTTIIVAQRITAVKNCDFIVILENGRISEMGTHEELIGKGGYYSKIYRIQQGLATKEEIDAAVAALV